MRKPLKYWATALTAIAALAIVGGASAKVEADFGSAKATVRTMAEVIFIEGAANKTCGELDSYGSEGASWSDLKFDSGDLPTVGNSATKSNSYLSVTLERTGTDTWSWSSTQGIDAVFIKSGASGGNLYLYDPPSEATSGSGLTTPGKNATSHVSFCYDEEQAPPPPPPPPPPPADLVVHKTAAGSFDVQHNWSIDKQVKVAGADDATYSDNAVLNLPDGGAGSFTWKVTVEKTTTETNFAVSGTISVGNSSASAVSGVSVSDPGGVVDCDAAAGVQNTGLTVPANGSINCTYTATPASKVATNTATASWSGKSASATATIAWTKGSDIGLPATVNDGGDIDNLQLTAGTTVTYDERWTCSHSTPSPNDGRTNTAVVTWNGGTDSDSASVQVGCDHTPPPPPPPPPPPTVQTDEFMDVQVIKDGTAQVQLVNGQAEIAYTVRVRNNGPNQAHNVVLSDAAPAGVTFLAVTLQPVGGSCTVTPALLSCTLGTLGPGVERTIGLSARATQTGTHVNCATATGSGKDTNGANNTECASTLVTAPVTPPTVTPKPKPKPKPQPEICRVLKVTPGMVKANGKRTTVFAKVTQSKNPIAGVAVRFTGIGLSKVVKTNAKGEARFGLAPSKAGIVLVKITSAKACNSARIGVVGVFEPPVTG